MKLFDNPVGANLVFDPLFPIKKSPLKGITVILIISMLCFPLTPSNAQLCKTNQYCKAEDFGKTYDFRGQSTYGKFSPGDTCKVQAILYSGNDIRIMTCSEPKLGQVQFKVYKMVKEYRRIVNKIEQKENQIPVYKTNKKGKPIPKLDDWGKPLRDNYGDIVFEIVAYKKVSTVDTIWKIERKSKELILFDSRKGSRIYNNSTTETEQIMIEMIVPKTNDLKLRTYKGCVGIMIGRIFHTTSFKSFAKSE